MNDLISRQAAIDALRKMQTYKLFSGDDMLLIDQAGAQTELMMLPPALPEPMKIDLSRCSEENWERIKKEWANTPITAEPEPKRGKWVFKNDLLTVPTGYWECSECKEGRLLYEENFCPNCGTDMRGEQDE